MHKNVLVTIEDDNFDSATARKSSEDKLYDEGFVDSEKLFNGAWGDWFVIGGRWTGKLAGSHDLPDYPGVDRPKEDREIGKADADADDTPYRQRSQYRQIGYCDDAMLVTQELYDKHLKQYEGESQSQPDAWETPDFVDLQGDEVDESFIGKKWLVVVDLHS
jgi:hypothetical protein